MLKLARHHASDRPHQGHGDHKQYGFGVGEFHSQACFGRGNAKSAEITLKARKKKHGKNYSANFYR
jgi:hypothetical protein